VEEKGDRWQVLDDQVRKGQKKAEKAEGYLERKGSGNIIPAGS
jgi:hypothetical protein